MSYFKNPLSDSGEENNAPGGGAVMLTANWQTDKVGDTRQWYLNNGRTFKLEMCVKSGSPGEWKTVYEVTLPNEVGWGCVKDGTPGEWVELPPDHKNGQWGFGKFK